MFSLLLILLVVGVSLGVALFVGSLFVQGYIYLQPSATLTWGAPAMAGILFFFYTLWCLLVVFSGSSPTDIRFDVLQRFSPRASLTSTPARELWAERKGNKTERYVLKKFVRAKGDAG